MISSSDENNNPNNTYTTIKIINMFNDNKSEDSTTQ